MIVILVGVLYVTYYFVGNGGEKLVMSETQNSSNDNFYFDVSVFLSLHLVTFQIKTGHIIVIHQR
jgi:hypothetical protein